jgi:hypothetical protein
MPVSAMHDDDLVHFDLIQVTKPSTCTRFPKVFRAAPGQICVEIPPLPSKERRAFPVPVGEIETRRSL